MGETQVLKCCSTLTIILTLISLGFFRGTNSETYTVGDDEEWSTGTNFLAWSERHNFSVGDVLVFKYIAGQHNAYEVTEATYKSCNDSSGVLARYNSGDDKVRLTEVKKYWFICTINGHCLGGMRFTIEVNQAISAAAPSTNATDGGRSPPATEPSPPETSPASRSQALAASCLVFAFWVVAVISNYGVLIGI